MKHALDLWASLFSNHAGLRTTLDFLHVGGLLGGGGAAIAADRAALTAHRRPDLADWLDSFHTTHKVVLTGVVVILVSGLLLFAADVDTYFYSRVFWIKMALFLALLINGAQLVRTESVARAGNQRAGSRLRVLASISVALWFLVTLAGTALPNIS